MNVFDVRITSLINSVSACWHVAGVLIIVGACIFVPVTSPVRGYVFGQTINNSGFSGHGWGELAPSSGLRDRLDRHGAVHTDGLRRVRAHVGGDAHGVALGGRSGWSTSVVVSVVAGFILLVAITFAIPSKTEVQTQFTYITTYIWQTSMSKHWAEVLLFIVVGAQFFCLTACVTSGSRMLFAFSRDRAVPGTSGAGGRSHGIACPSSRSPRWRPPRSC